MLDTFLLSTGWLTFDSLLSVPPKLETFFFNYTAGISSKLDSLPNAFPMSQGYFALTGALLIISSFSGTLFSLKCFGTLYLIYTTSFCSSLRGGAACSSINSSYSLYWKALILTIFLTFVWLFLNYLYSPNDFISKLNFSSSLLMLNFDLTGSIYSGSNFIT